MYSFREDEQNRWFVINDVLANEIPWNKGKKETKDTLGFNEWNSWSRMERRDYRTAWIKMNKPMNLTATDIERRYGIWLGDLQSSPAPSAYGAQKQETKDNTMYANAYVVANANAIQTQANPDAETKMYLRDRLMDEYRKKCNLLREKYGLNKDDSPKDRFQLVEWIKKGWYTLEEPAKDGEDEWYGYTGGIIWGDPSIKRDVEGYTEAAKKLDAARQSTKDLIIVSAPADGLKALDKFIGQTFN
jgi:hypothetical protein